MNYLLFFLGGMVALAILQSLVRKGVKMAKNKADVAWSAHLTHNEKKIFIQGKDLGMGADRFVAGPLKGLSPDYGQAEWNLIAQTLLRYAEDGKTLWKTGDSMDKLPYSYDPEIKKTTGEVVLTYLITKQYPHLADKYETAFEEYYDEELLATLMGEENPAEKDFDEPPNPTTPTLVEPFGSEEP